LINWNCSTVNFMNFWRDISKEMSFQNFGGKDIEKCHHG